MRSRSYILNRLPADVPFSKRQPSLARRLLLRAPVEVLLVIIASVSSGNLLEPVAADEIVVQQSINPDREATVKAVFLYSYGRYITWPQKEEELREDAFVIAVLGASPTIPKLQQISEKRTIVGRTLRVIQVESPDDIPDCQILFVAGYADNKLRKAIEVATSGKPILIVGESVGFAEQGAAINFYTSGNHVRFQINAKAVHERKLLANAQLLNLGDRVGELPEK